MLSFRESGTQKIYRIFDKHFGDLDHKKLFGGNVVPNPKINFHRSGQYKLSVMVGRSEDSVDRCTVLGKSLDQITKPERMLEILLPNRLRISNKSPCDRDIVLDASSFPAAKQLRCTVLCMAKGCFEEFTKHNGCIVDTSEMETYQGLEDGKMIWTFVLRVSRNDTQVSKQYFFFMPGTVRWGNKIGTII